MFILTCVCSLMTQLSMVHNFAVNWSLVLILILVGNLPIVCGKCWPVDMIVELVAYYTGTNIISIGMHILLPVIVFLLGSSNFNYATGFDDTY